MQLKFVSNGFILNAYCKNELHDMKNESNESNEWRFGHIWSKPTSKTLAKKLYYQKISERALILIYTQKSFLCLLTHENFWGLFLYKLQNNVKKTTVMYVMLI
jgi:hypothetical protein